jgi:LytS/YehU family sensor histidine kinase
MIAARWTPLLRLLALAAAIALSTSLVLAIKLALLPEPPSTATVLHSTFGVFMVEFLVHASTVLTAAALLARGQAWPAAALAATAATLAMVVLQLPLRQPGTPLVALIDYLPYLVVRHGTLAALVALLLDFTQRRRAALQRLHEAEQARLAQRRDLDAAQLALLHAQIEPHFLFNSLANVRRLLRTDRSAARELLVALRRYLQEALPSLRQSHTTLAREAELVRAYLALHQVRMGPRLVSEVDVPAALGGLEIPPMLLLTLVENAIKHGLAPLPEGGRVCVRARREGGRVLLTVADTGCGLGHEVGHGTGLVNLQARLKARYGSQATLTLRLNEPRGVTAEVALPGAA